MLPGLFLTLGGLLAACEQGQGNEEPQHPGRHVPHTLSDVGSPNVPPANGPLASVSASLAAAAEQPASDGGILFQFRIVNAGAAGLELINPLDLFNLELWRESGKRMELPRKPHRLKINTKDPARDVVALPFSVRSVEIRPLEQSTEPQGEVRIVTDKALSDRAIFLPPNSEFLYQCWLDRILVTTGSVSAERPLPAGKYSLGSMVSLVPVNTPSLKRTLRVQDVLVAVTP